MESNNQEQWSRQYGPNQFPQSSYGGPQPSAPAPKRGRLNRLFIPFLVVLLLAIIFGGFGIWAYLERDQYKNKTDDIVARAVAIAKQETASQKDKEFLEKEKQPFKEYQGPSDLGSLKLNYPKTWAAFISTNKSGSRALEGYLHPNFVPGLQSGTAFALRLEIVDQTYANELKKFDGAVKNNKVKVEPFRAKNAPNVLGAKVVGEINKGQKDTMVLLPLRDKTIKLWTESDQFVADFENVVLPALNFVP